MGLLVQRTMVPPTRVVRHCHFYRRPLLHHARTSPRGCSPDFTRSGLSASTAGLAPAGADPANLQGGSSLLRSGRSRSNAPPRRPVLRHAPAGSRPAPASLRPEQIQCASKAVAPPPRSGRIPPCSPLRSGRVSATSTRGRSRPCPGRDRSVQTIGGYSPTSTLPGLCHFHGRRSLAFSRPGQIGCDDCQQPPDQ